MEIDDLLNICVKIGLLLNALIDLLEERFVDKRLDAANGKVRHKILPIAEVTQTVESVKNIFFEVVECLGLVLHAEPKHPWRVVASEDARAVEIHAERLMPLGHLLASLNNLWDVLIGRVAHEFQGQVNLVGFAPINVAALVLQIILKTLHQSWIFFPYGNGNSKKSTFHFFGFSSSKIIVRRFSIGTRTWFIVSRSRTVTVLSTKVSLSTVTHIGVPMASCLL